MVDERKCCISLELAIAARQEAEDRYHGEFASHRSAE